MDKSKSDPHSTGNRSKGDKEGFRRGSLEDRIVFANRVSERDYNPKYIKDAVPCPSPSGQRAVSRSDRHLSGDVETANQHMKKCPTSFK